MRLSPFELTQVRLLDGPFKDAMLRDRFRQISVAMTMPSIFSGILSGSELSLPGDPDDLPALRCHDNDRADEANPTWLPDLSMLSLSAPVQ